MELKERIIEEATRLFAAEGIKSVRMDDIAAVCGISKRTLYEIFADRDDLIRQSLRYYVKVYEETINKRLEKAENVLDEFWILFGHGDNFREVNKVVMRDLVKFYPGIFNDFMKEYHRKVLKANADRFRRGQDAGFLLRNLDAEFMSHNLTDYLYGMKHSIENIENKKAKWDNVKNVRDITPRSFPFVMMLYFRGLSTEKGRKYIDQNILKGLE